MTTEEMIEKLIDCVEFDYHVEGPTAAHIIAKLRSAEELARVIALYEDSISSAELGDALSDYRKAGGGG